MVSIVLGLDPSNEVIKPASMNLLYSEYNGITCVLYLTLCYCMLLDEAETSVDEMRDTMSTRLQMKIGDTGYISKSEGMKHVIHACLVDRELVDISNTNENFLSLSMEAAVAKKEPADVKKALTVSVLSSIL